MVLGRALGNERRFKDEMHLERHCRAIVLHTKAFDAVVRRGNLMEKVEHRF